MEPPVTRISSKLTICFTLPYSQRKITGIGRFVDDLARKLQNAHIESMTLAPWTSGTTSEEASLRLRGTFLLNFQLGVLTAVRLFRLRRKFQILHAQHAQIQSLAACMTARILGKPSVITLHGQVPDPSGWVRKALKRLAERLSVRIATKVVAVSTFVAEQFSKNSGEIEVIENGVDTKVFRPNESKRAQLRSSLGIGTKLTFIFAGRWAKSKGIDLVLEAIRSPRLSSRHFVLLLAGEADPADVDDSLRTSDLLAAQSHVRILGPVSETLPDILGAADVFVLPSLHEGMPLGLLEGMATGLPALVSDIEVNRMIVEGSGCGWTFRSGDAVDLSNVMDEIVTKGVPPSFPAKARAAVERYHNLDDEVRRYVSVYDRLVGGCTAVQAASPGNPGQLARKPTRNRKSIGG